MEFAQFLQAISVIVAAISAAIGFNSWRRSLIGKRHVELAEDGLAMFYEAARVIRAIRSPMGFQGEGETRRPQPEETAEQKTARDRAFVVMERYNREIELFSKIDAIRWRFQAYFGKNTAAPFDELRGIIATILSHARVLSDLWAYRASGVWQAPQHDADIRNAENVIWETLPENDQITPRVDAVIEKIEGICVPIINPKRNIYSMIDNARKQLRVFFAKK